MKKIIYRPYKPQDFNALSEIINITWGHEKSYSPATAVRLSNTYLRLCLAEQTFTQVALNGGKPVGVIMGNSFRNHYRPLRFQFQAKWDLFMLSLTGEGRRARHFFGEIDRIYEKLLSRQLRHYEGELSFFAIHPDYRGLGIGKELYLCFLNYMKGENVQHFYVFTDTTCNYGFYEHHNMLRCGTEEVSLLVNYNPTKFSFFIYENGPIK